MTRSGRRGPHLVQFDEPRPTQLFDVDGGLIFCSSQRRDRPRGFQEFTASPDQIRGAGAHLFRVAHQHRRAVGQLIGQQRVPVGPEHRQHRLHAVDRDALGELRQHVGSTAGDGALGRGMPCGQLGGPRPHVLAQQQFTAGEGNQCVNVDLRNRALVGYREHPHLGDLVAPELDPHRMFGRRGKDVQNPAAHSELAAPADHIHPGICQLDQPRHHAVEGGFVANGQREGLHHAQLRRHGLQQRAHRGHHYPQRWAQLGIVGVGQPAQRHQASADGVNTG
ncbi:Uncharacterised protein [Mycobacterium tuberculosis]|nr:Uncharacterised protein [Mycobacterium tuberculosis]CFS05964.1 Uncharacterised protein [Mycobacterium tuberculosis]CFS33086.1 Uncharacterised protein [Mycobacterium tuberculosis]CFS50883.1 Uncharacterised protein [Mycobacterium tuberculosis]CKM50401.1 Uncharacterised protein [Mycobacterium tuberculosis]